MPLSLRSILWGYRKKLVAWQLERLVKDSTYSPEEGNNLTTELAAKLRSVESQWLYTVVGQALSSWAMVEEDLVVIATMLLRVDVSKAGVIFYSIINFNIWLSIIGELFRMDEDFGKLIPSWNKISHELRALKNTRDNLAHQTMHHNRPEGDISLRPGRF